MGKRIAVRTALATPSVLALVWLIRHLWGEATWWSYLIWAIPEGVWLFAVLVPVACGLAYGRDRRVRLAVRLGCLAALFLSLAICEPRIRRLKEPDPKNLKVLQLNMEHGLEGVERIARLIERERPDILFLEEAGPLGEAPDRILPEMKRALSGYQVHRSRFEAVAVKGTILAREVVDLPETDKERAEKPGKVLTAVRADVRGHVLRLVALHFSPSRFDEALESSPWLMPSYLDRMAAIRSGQYAKLRDYIRLHANESIIVAGDFNAHPAGADYRRLASIATDAFAAAGSGFGFSLTANAPVERFDYIWCKNVEPVRCEVLPDIVSDHRAVVAWVNP